MEYITKITKNEKINKWNGLTREQAFTLEKDCLTILNNNFECICNLKCSSHFPIIKELIEDKFTFILSNCGPDIKSYNKHNIEKMHINNINEQIDCIIHNLEKNKIINFDLSKNGKNICVSKEGIISMIDFDMAVIDNNILSTQLQKYYDKQNKNNVYYDNCRKKLMIITKDFSNNI